MRKVACNMPMATIGLELIYLGIPKMLREESNEKMSHLKSIPIGKLQC